MNRPHFPENCPIRERTGDGISVGRCWFYIGAKMICPRHGNVSKAIKLFVETGDLVEEFDNKPL